MAYRIGIDIGGTFTDFALFDEAGGAMAIHKRLTSADDPAAAVLDGLARMLADAGVPIALSSFGADVGEFRSLVASVIEAGLSPDEALRAVTTTPAELLGLDGVIGTVERGKLANLLVTDGDLFDDDTDIIHVFVEGQRFDYEREDNPEDDENGRNGSRGGRR